jgi:hypothetical protein
MASALVAFAVIGGKPTASNAPKEKNVPPPATAFSVPAMKPATERIRISASGMAFRATRPS